MENGQPREAARAALRLAPRPSVVGAAPVAELDPAVVRKGFRKKREAAVKNFVAIAPHLDNAAILIECIYTAHLLKKRHPGFRTGILVHPANARLAEESGVFDAVFAVRSDRTLRREILELNPDVIYSPDPDWRAQLSTLFTGASVKIGGLRLRLVTRLLGFFDSRDAEDLVRLERRGIKLVPEPVVLSDSLALADAPGLPAEPFVWLSLFDDHGVSGHWPVGHGARLVRLIEAAGLRTVIPLPASRPDLEKEVAYLQKTASTVTLVAGESPQSRAAGMARAAAVVAPAGAETLLASMVGRPVVLLHDMRSYGGGRGLKIVETKPGSRPDERVRGRRGEGVLLRAVEALERHIKPSVDECINDCPACVFHSCMEHISPERVFENLKKVLLPF